MQQRKGKKESTVTPDGGNVKKQQNKSENRFLGIVGRGAVVVIGLYGWFWSQSLIQSQGPILAGQPLRDSLLDALTPFTSYLNDNPLYANWLLISSSLVIDIVGVFLLTSSVLGKSVRPFLSMLILYAMRQICQMIVGLPEPVGMVWRDPGFPSLLVTYETECDFFFSGHTGIAVIGAVEIMRIGRSRSAYSLDFWFVLAMFVAVFEMSAVLVLKAHYTMDVFTGAVAARYASMLGKLFAPYIDSFISRLSSRV